MTATDDLVKTISKDVGLTLTILETLCAKDDLTEAETARLQQFALSILSKTI